MVEKIYRHIKKHVYIDEGEVKVEMSGRGKADSIFGGLIATSVLVSPYFTDIHWFLKIIFIVATFFLITIGRWLSYERVYLNNYIVQEEDKHRVQIIKKNEGDIYGKKR